MNIVWDFDGTILPLTPHDSEQSLLSCIVKEMHPHVLNLKGLLTRAIIYADMKGWIGHYFKPLYLWAAKGTKEDIIERVTEELAGRISMEDRNTLKALQRAGHKQVLISCGTENLSRAVLHKSGILKCFSDVVANRFIFKDHVISGIEYRTLKPADKLNAVISMGFNPEDTIVVGDGPTDIPLLNWSVFPVVIRRNNNEKAGSSGCRYSIISEIADIIPYVKGIYRGNLKFTQNP